MDCLKCGGEAQLDLRKGKIGYEVWFKCGCGYAWQDYCHSCQNPLEVSKPDDLCVICGGQ